MKIGRTVLVDILVGIVLGVLFLGVFYYSDYAFSFFDKDTRHDDNSFVLSEPYISNSKYGYDVSDFYFEYDKVKSNQFLGSILYWEGVSFSTIDKLVKASKDVFDVRMIRPGKNIAFVHRDSCGPLQSFIYEPNNMKYIVFNLSDSIYVEEVIRPIETKIEYAYGTVASSLWNSMRGNNLNISLIDKMEDALSSEVDFYSAQKGDKYKLLFERKYIDGKPVAIGKLIGAYYDNGQPHYAIHYESDLYKGYYNYEGAATKKAFLKAPVRFSRISSGFSYRRYHPIQHRIKAHYGTDYAAPYGTPIQAVAAGTIVRRGYGVNNGRYVTIKHDKTYTTTYLHMQKFGKFKKGMHVNQGDVIGYVGSTGLATGPHVCFRMKKNGRPIDHRRENFPSPEPLPDSLLTDYYVVRDSIMTIINEMSQVPSDSQPLVLKSLGTSK